jgi:hypothetical protein
VVRYRSWITTGLIVVGLVVLFVMFIGFREDADLVAALEAAGTVAAAGFAAVAGVAAMRAANESSATARRARETLARSARPRISLRVEVAGDRLHGLVRCADGPAAVDATVAWLRADGETVTGQAARLAPGDGGMVVDLGPAGTASAVAAVEMVWMEYWDDSRVGRWQDTWRVEAGRLQQTDSQLVD